VYQNQFVEVLGGWIGLDRTRFQEGLMTVLLRGLVIGFAIAAPVGPIGVLCIRRTLTEGRVSGFLAGLGAATADALYGCVAGFGLTFVSSTLVDQQVWFRLVGGVFLCYLGFRSFFAPPAEKAAEVKGRGLLGAYASTFALTLTNPMTILSFGAVFAGLGVAEGGSYESAGALVLGVFIGSALWWSLLSGMASLFRERVTSQGMRWINRISGIVVLVFGVVALASLGGAAY
jgi:threonine/homoserine/homoserine lactone efflux protein